MPTSFGAMTRQEVLELRDDALATARRHAAVAANTKLCWGIRYHAAVAGDDFSDIAKACDEYLREFSRIL